MVGRLESGYCFSVPGVISGISFTFRIVLNGSPRPLQSYTMSTFSLKFKFGNEQFSSCRYRWIFSLVDYILVARTSLPLAGTGNYSGTMCGYDLDQAGCHLTLLWDTREFAFSFRGSILALIC